MRNNIYLTEEKVKQAILGNYEPYDGVEMWVEKSVYGVLDEDFVHFYLCERYVSNNVEVNTRVHLTDQDLADAFNKYLATTIYEVTDFTPSTIRDGYDNVYFMGMDLNVRRKGMKKELV